MLPRPKDFCVVNEFVMSIYQHLYLYLTCYHPSTKLRGVDYRSMRRYSRVSLLIFVITRLQCSCFSGLMFRGEYAICLFVVSRVLWSQMNLRNYLGNEVSHISDSCGMFTLTEQGSPSKFGMAYVQKFVWSRFPILIDSMSPNKASYKVLKCHELSFHGD